jgi:hypothetical protein
MTIPINLGQEVCETVLLNPSPGIKDGQSVSEVLISQRAVNKLGQSVSEVLISPRSRLSVGQNVSEVLFSSETFPKVGQSVSEVVILKEAVPSCSQVVSEVVVARPLIPSLTWDTPAFILVGTPLSAMQLNASSNISGTFTYNPPIGTVLSSGINVLTALFVPTNLTNWYSETISVNILVGSAVFTTTDFSPVNSTTYCDVVGLSMGLERLPGETSTRFLTRASQAITGTRDHSYEGLINQLSMEFNLEIKTGISITYSGTSLQLFVEIGQIKVITENGTTIIPTVNTAVDNYWTWKLLSEVITSLNNISGISAILTGIDGSALQLIKQSNLVTVVNQSIMGQDQFLGHINLVLGSESFNVHPGIYELNYNTGEIIFEGNPTSNLMITYQWTAPNYNLICAPFNVFSLTDKSISETGVNSEGIPVYQVQEILQDIMSNDLSYWAV